MEERICDKCKNAIEGNNGVKIIAIADNATLIAEDNFNPTLNFNLCFDCFKDMFEIKTPNEE